MMRRPVLTEAVPTEAALPEVSLSARAASPVVAEALPALAAETLERLAMAVSARLRGRLMAAERRLGQDLSADQADILHDQIAEVEWLLTRIDMHVAIARDCRGTSVDLDPALHDLLTAGGKLTAFPLRRAAAPGAADGAAGIAAA